MATITNSDEADPPKRVAEDLVSLDGKPAILSIMPIVPSSDRVTQEPGAEYLHVAVKFIDDRVVGKIARQYMLADAHVLPLLATHRECQRSPGRLARRHPRLYRVDAEPAGIDADPQDRPGAARRRRCSSPAVLWFLLRRLRRASNELQSSQDHAQFLAFHDRLTGLPNRALFEDRLKRAIVGAQRQPWQDRAALHRSRPLQDRQRYARPPGRRRTGAPDRAPPGSPRQGDRHRRPARRRRVRHRAGRHQERRRRRGSERQAAGGSRPARSC